MSAAPHQPRGDSPAAPSAKRKKTADISTKFWEAGTFVTTWAFSLAERLGIGRGGGGGPTGTRSTAASSPSAAPTVHGDPASRSSAARLVGTPRSAAATTSTPTLAAINKEIRILQAGGASQQPSAAAAAAAAAQSPAATAAGAAAAKHARAAATSTPAASTSAPVVIDLTSVDESVIVPSTTPSAWTPVSSSSSTTTTTTTNSSRSSNTTQHPRPSSARRRTRPGSAFRRRKQVQKERVVLQDQDAKARYEAAGYRFGDVFSRKQDELNRSEMSNRSDTSMTSNNNNSSGRGASGGRRRSVGSRISRVTPRRTPTSGTSSFVSNASGNSRNGSIFTSTPGVAAAPRRNSNSFAGRSSFLASSSSSSSSSNNLAYRGGAGAGTGAGAGAADRGAMFGTDEHMNALHRGLEDILLGRPTANATAPSPGLTGGKSPRGAHGWHKDIARDAPDFYRISVVDEFQARPPVDIADAGAGKEEAADAAALDVSAAFDGNMHNVPITPARFRVPGGAAFTADPAARVPPAADLATLLPPAVPANGSGGGGSSDLLNTSTSKLSLGEAREEAEATFVSLDDSQLKFDQKQDAMKEEIRIVEEVEHKFQQAQLAVQQQSEEEEQRIIDRIDNPDGEEDEGEEDEGEEDEDENDGGGAAAAAGIAPLAPEEEAAVLTLWDRNDDKGLLIERLAVRILVENLRTLSGNEWVDDQIINFYRNLCQVRNDADDSLPKIWIGRTNMYNMIKEQGPEKVKRWTKKVKPNVFERDMILFPMNLNDSHWCCGCVNMKKKRFELYDSMGIHEREFYGHMRKWLTMEAEKEKVAINLDEWTDYDEDDTIPRQHNYFDCGVFALMFMSHLALGKPFAFSQADMPDLRKRMAHEIVNDSLLPL